MKWQKLMPGISIILSGIVTMSMKVVTGVNVSRFGTAVSQPAHYDNGVYENAAERIDILYFSPLVYLIGGLLIVAGAFMLYNEIKEATHEN